MNRKPTTHTSAKTFRRSELQTPWLMCLALLAALGLATSAWATTETLTDTNNWTVPSGVTSVTVEMWGAGGGGGAKAVSGSAGRGSGGGGGGYMRTNLTVTPGSLIAYSVGSGGTAGSTNGPTAPTAGGNTTFDVYTANGGSAGTNKTSATIVSGGPGGTGLTANGGRGGNEAGNNNNGGNGGGAGGWTGSAGQAGTQGADAGNVAGVGGGTAPSKGGDGGVAGGGLTGGSGNTPGGGAAGGSGASGPQNNGGVGADGTIILTYTAAQPQPIVDTPTKSGITNTGATLGATVVTNSGTTIDDYGIVYSTSNADPTVGDTKVQKGTDDFSGSFTTNITGLAAGTLHYFKGYAHNASGYGYSPVGTFYTLDNEPTTQASGVTISSAQRSAFTISWTIGNGANRIVLVKAGSAVDASLVDGTTYTATNVFGTASAQIGTNGNYAVYLGTGTSVNVSGLTIGTTYHVAVYELNGTGGTENYLTPPATGSATAVANIYYSTGVNPASAANWTNNIGASPANFNGGDTFVILSGQSVTASDSWTNNNGATLIIESGATLDMFDASRKLLIKGSFVNNGTLINSSDSSAPIVNFINSSVAGGSPNYTSTLTVGSNYNVSAVAIGGGGGGASAGNPSNSIPVQGGGGGGGASAYSTNLLLVANTAYQVTVGGNGSRGTAGASVGFGNSGGAGGASSFGGGFLTTVIANGGAGGLAGTTNAAGADGAGGAASIFGNASNNPGGNGAAGGGGGAAGDGASGVSASAGTGGSGGTGSVTAGGNGASVVSNTNANFGADPGGGAAGANWTSGAGKEGGRGGVGWVSVQFNSVSTAPTTVNYLYQSKASGSWSDTNTWSVDKGSGFVNAVGNELPGNGHSSVAVQSGHTVTVAVQTVAVALTVDGTLTVNGGTLSVNRLAGQTNANNLTVNGTLNVQTANALFLGATTTNLIASAAVLNHNYLGAIGDYGTDTKLTINGSYVQNVTGSGKIPVATWGAASTCTINSTFTSNVDDANTAVQLNYGQTFGNFIWNAKGGTTNVVWRMTQSTATSWSATTLTILNTSGPAARLEIAGPQSQPMVVNIGSIAMTNGNFRAGGGGLDLTVAGTIAITGAATFDTAGSIKSGAITVASGSTIGGAGRIGAPSVTLAAGASAAIRLFDTNNTVNSTLHVTNSLVLNGNTLYVESVDYVLGDGDYVLMTNITGTISGSLASTPVISGLGLAPGKVATVVTTANKVVLHVAAAPSDPPVITSTVRSGSDLIISGTNATGTAGGTYYVRATNVVTAPIAGWPRISTNTYGVGGAFSVTNQIDLSTPKTFYRLEQ